jgi:YD repeat-containing protein
LSSAGLIEAVQESVEDLLASELSFLLGVVALGLEGGAELDGGDEEGAGLTDRFEVAVELDGAGRQRAVIPAGSMQDAGADPQTSAPATSEGVSYRLVGAGQDGTLAVQVTLDAAWLKDPARKYPVLVDPSVDTSSASSSLVVTDNGSSSGAQTLQVGKGASGRSASYLAFAGIETRLAFHTIFGAQLQLVNFDAASCRPRPVTVHPVTASWSSTTSTSYPGPAVGSALASSSFAYGFIAPGQTTSACPTSRALINLGTAGRDLVQRWVNGTQANHGLSIRASETDALGWKRFAGDATANPPRLFVTHSPYNANYSFVNPVPSPPVTQIQSGTIKIAVTNRGAETWTPTTYYLAYRAYNSKGVLVTQQRAANLSGNVARGAKVTLDATIQALPPDVYVLDFTMVDTGGPVFTDEQVPPGRLVLQVFDIAPVLQSLYPPNGYQAPTLTPQLFAQAIDLDAPASSLQYKFEVCEQDATGAAVNCFQSVYQASLAWTVPAGSLSWSKTYLWRAFVKDTGGNEVISDRVALLTTVPQPELTSRLASAPYGTPDREFDPQTGNFSTAAVDATVATAGPELSVVRTYNSLDPRTDGMFGAGWVSRYDAHVTPDNDGSGNVVVTYPDGQQVRFGKNPDGSYAAPPGRVAQLTQDATTLHWKLLDKSGATYEFAAAGVLIKITDASVRSVVMTLSSTTGKIVRATDSAGGRSLTFTWTGAHVTSVSTDPVGGIPLTWSYTYSGDLLAQVCAPGSVCTGYEYASGSHYRSVVLDARPESYWRFGEPEGTAANSEIAVNLGADRGTYQNVTLGAAGPVAGGPGAATFDGTSSQVSLPGGIFKKSRDAAVEVWFKTIATGIGGPLVGYQDKAITDTPTVGVPLLYVGQDGLLRGGFWTGSVAPITAPSAVNNGQWHHAVLSLMGSTETLYVDGSVAGTRTGVTVNQGTLTHNQIGAGYATSTSSWPGWGSTALRHFAGSIAEVAVYSHPLGPATVALHRQQALAAASELAKVTLPSGRVAAQVTYDPQADRVGQYVDRNGGTWKLGAPTVYGDASDLRRAVQVLDPAGRASLYEYDALAGRLVRSGTPTGIGVREEDLPPSSTTTTAPPTTVCTTPDPGDPTFCTTPVPPDDGVPDFERHAADGMALRTYAYDARGFPSLVTDENGDQVTFTYDDRGNITSRTTCRTATECHTAFWTYDTTVSAFDPRAQQPIAFRDARSASATDPTYQTSYLYTAGGWLVQQTNSDGGIIKHTYTNGATGAIGGGVAPPGLLQTTTDQRTALTAYGYNKAGDLMRLAEPSGLVTTFTYDELGRRTSQTQTSDTYPSGLVTTYAYDALSRLTSTTEPATTEAVTGTRHQRKTSYTYDPDGNLTQVKLEDLLGGDSARTMTFGYDDHGQVEQVTDPEGGETSYGYDPFGNRTFMVDAGDNRFEYAYTARNMLAEVRLRDWDGADDPEAGSTLVVDSYAYDLAGRPVRHTDAMGRQADTTYYNDDLVKDITLKGFHNPDGTTRDYLLEADTYDGDGNITRQVTANGKLTTDYTINKVGLIDSTTVDPGGLARRTAYAYDRTGNITQITRTGNASNVPWALSTTAEVVSYTYDLAGRETRQTVSDAANTMVTSFAYDQRSLMTATTDPRGNATGADPTAYTTTYAYDELARQTSTQGPPLAAESGGGAPQTVNPQTLTGYDTFDDPTATKDPLGNVSTATYDRLGRVATASAPSYTPPGGTALTPTTQTVYDGLGNPTSVTDPRGNLTRYTYDRLNHLVTRDEPTTTNNDRAVWSYTSTRLGDVLSVTDPTGAKVQATYDDLDRPVTATQVERRPQADTFTSTTTYDDLGDVTRLTAPSGAPTTNLYDTIGQLTRTTDAAGVSTQLGYDKAGRQARVTDGLGRTTRSDYDLAGRLTSQADLKPDGSFTPLRQQTYAYDLAGNLATTTDPLDHTNTYTYDAADRLTRQVEPTSATASITTTFGYDAAGNRTRTTDGRGNPTITTYNSLGLPEQLIEPSTTAQPNLPDRTWTTSYDAAGNPATLAAPGGVTRQRTLDAAMDFPPVAGHLR